MNYNEARKSASDNMQMAMVAEIKGEIEESLRFFELAFEAEKQAALSLLANFDNEPTRSITFRSAAALAMDCKKYEEAKKMVHFGLAGNPPEDIAQELMDIYERVHQEILKQGKQLTLVEIDKGFLQRTA